MIKRIPFSFVLFIDFLIILFAFVVRLKEINTPFTDGYSWRQGVTASIARNFLKEDFNILHPRQNEIVPEQNFGRYFFLEFPIYEFTVAIFYKIFGEHFWVARSVTILSSTIASLFLFWFCIEANKRIIFASFAVILFNIFPVSFFFGRTILPDMMAVMFLTGVLYFLLRFFLEKQNKFLFLSALFLAFAGLIKPYSFIYFPLLLLIVYKNFREESKEKRLWFKIRNLLIIVACLSYIVFVPFFAWRFYQIIFYPEADPTPHIYPLIGLTYLKSYKNYLEIIITDRIFDKTFTFWGGIFACLGIFFILFKIFNNKKKFFYRLIFLWFLLAIFYLLIVCDGNYGHQYYQLPLAPIFAILASQGILFTVSFFLNLYKREKNIMNFFLILLASGIGTIIFSHSLWQYEKILTSLRWREVPYWKEIPTIQKIIPQNSLLIVSGWTRNPTFLDFTNRHGWVINSEFLENNDCPPEYLANAQNYKIQDRVLGMKNLNLEKTSLTINEVFLQKSYYGYFLPFVSKKKDMEAKYIVLIRKEMPKSFRVLESLLNKNFSSVYRSQEVLIYKI